MVRKRKNGQKTLDKFKMASGEWEKTKYEYDKKGNLIHAKRDDSYEGWFKYDEKGHKIYSKNSMGYEFWYECDGNVIYRRDYDGTEWSFESDGNLRCLKMRIVK